MAPRSCGHVASQVSWDGGGHVSDTEGSAHTHTRLVFGRFLHRPVGLEGRHQPLHLPHGVREAPVVELQHLESNHVATGSEKTSQDEQTLGFVTLVLIQRSRSETRLSYSAFMRSKSIRSPTICQSVKEFHCIGLKKRKQRVTLL